MPPTLRIISGGQTGADYTALCIARELGLPTGGWAPHAWTTEEGHHPELAEYGLVECAFASYRIRTRWNVRDSDGTVIFGRLESPGSSATLQHCIDMRKPVIVNPDADALYDWLVRHQPLAVLNVAGNRRSTNPKIGSIVRAALTPALQRYIERPCPV